MAIDTNGGLWLWGRKLTLVESYQADPARVALGNSGSTAKAISLNSSSALILDTQGAV